MECPTEDTLLAVVGGRFAGDTSSAYAHIEACPTCRTLLNELARSYGREGEEPREGQSVGRYQLRRLLGIGGMGVVYAAHDPELDRHVAIKLLRADVDTENADLRARLLREAQVMARLSHPNVIAVHDVGLHGDQVFIAMELIDGQTLRHWLAEPRPWREVVGVLVLAGRGLAAAHEVGIVHRDFKPDNVMIGRNGSVRVLDFGLARAVANAPKPLAAALSSALAHSLTGSAGLLGTPAYMAPEQLACEATDARTDQFSFCVALQESLTGLRPFVGATPHELLTAIRDGRKETTREAQIPSWLRNIIARGLRLNPDERFGSMSELLAALAHDPSVTRRRWLIAAAIVVALAATAVAANQQARRHASLICQGAPARLIGVWDSPRRERIRAAFLATGLPYAGNAFDATARKVDQYIQEWQAMHTDACRATRVRGEQSEEVMQLRMECLDRRREELRALADIFIQADGQVVQRAVSSATNLSGLDECRNTEALRTVVRPPAGATQARVAELRTRLAEITARRIAGRYQEGLKLAQAATEDTRALAYPPLLAEALTGRGQLEMRSGKADAALDTLIEAAAAAETGRYDHQLAYALTELVYICGEKLGRYADANRYALLAQAALARAGSDPKLEARLDQHRASILYGEERWDEALAILERAVAQSKELYGPKAPEVGVALLNVGEIYRSKADCDQAIEYDRQAIANFQDSYGPNHPQTGLAWHDLGAAFFGKHDWSAAIDAFGKALSIREAALGANHPDVAATLANLAIALLQQGHPDQALALLERGQAIERKTVGPESPAFAQSELNIATVLLKLNRLDAALEHATHALAIRGRVFDRQHPNVTVTIIMIAQVRVARHEYAEAVPLLERAIATLEHHPNEPDWLVQARFALARALWELGRDRTRARSLALTARESPGDERAAIDTWLAKHR